MVTVLSPPPSPSLSRIHRAALRLFAEKGQTQVSVSELAQAAGIARGTIYNNVPSVETLFESVAAHLAQEMVERIVAGFETTTDPAQRLANGVRYYIRRAHDEPHWGRFICRFALSHQGMDGLWSDSPMRDVLNGLAQRQYDFRPEQLPAVIAMVAGSVLASMFLVLEGHRTWREAGSDTAELVLRSLGVEPEQARQLATIDLPPLPDSH